MLVPERTNAARWWSVLAVRGRFTLWWRTDARGPFLARRHGPQAWGSPPAERLTRWGKEV